MCSLIFMLAAPGKVPIVQMQASCSAICQGLSSASAQEVSRKSPRQCRAQEQGQEGPGERLQSSRDRWVDRG